MAFPYDSTGISENGFVAPAGTYRLAIKSVKEKVTKNGDPMVSVKCEIDNNEWLGTPVWHNVTFMGLDEEGKPKKGAGMAIHFLKVIGEPWENKFVVDSNNWIGKTFFAKLKIEKDMNGLDRNQIAFIIEPMEGEQAPF